LSNSFFEKKKNHNKKALRKRKGFFYFNGQLIMDNGQLIRKKT
jgi:hypothetical protein